MTLPTVQFRAAETRDEIEHCYALVYREWEKLGYLSGGELRYSLFNALPQTTTFVGTNAQGKIFMTATVIPDSVLGMPIDATFKDKLVPYRESGRKIAEVSMLAFDSSTEQATTAQRLFLLLQMFSTLFSYARNENIEMLCAKVHTRHAASYEPLLFKDFGEVRDNPNVANMPVSGKILDITAVTQYCAQPQQANTFPCDAFFTTTTNPQSNTKYRFTSADLAYFFIQKQPIFKTLSTEQVAFLAEMYPEIDFPALLSTLDT